MTRDVRMTDNPCRVLVAYHGILTGLTDASWPEKFQSWLISRSEKIPIMLIEQYYAAPLPWVNWFKNRKHGKALAKWVEQLYRENPNVVGIDMVGHSNGCCILLDAIKRLDKKGIPVDRVVFIGAAIDERPSQNGLWEVASFGQLLKAVAYWSPVDKVIGLPWILKWPYGSLGRKGWRFPRGEGRHPAFQGREFPTMGHTGYFDPQQIYQTFRIIAEDLGIPLKPPPSRAATEPRDQPGRPASTDRQ